MLREFIVSDYYRYWGTKDTFPVILLKALFHLNDAFTFQFWFRLSGEKNRYYFLRCLARKMYRKYCRKCQIYMPLNVEVGYGLYMGHCMCMVIAGGTKIGNNCNLSQFLNIGSNEGKSAVIGDCVYIGPHVCIVDQVNIGENAIIGAGSVVTKDIPSGSTAVGVPARVISENNPGRFIKNKWRV